MASYRRIEVKPVAGAPWRRDRAVSTWRRSTTRLSRTSSRLGSTISSSFSAIRRSTPEQQLSLRQALRRDPPSSLHEGDGGSIPTSWRSSKRRATPRRSVKSWHTDQMFNPKPAKATILYAKETPDAGGDTLFTNLYMAYETLSEPMKAMLASVKTFNVGDRKKLMQAEKIGVAATARMPATSRWTAKLRDPGELKTEAAHPLVRTHPETGRKALYISNHTQTLDGFKTAEARPDPGLFGVTCGGARIHLSVPVGSLARWRSGTTAAPSTARSTITPASAGACIASPSRATPHSENAARLHVTGPVTPPRALSAWPSPPRRGPVDGEHGLGRDHRVVHVAEPARWAAWRRCRPCRP